MRAVALLALASLASLPFLPVAQAVEPIPDCVRNGPPCGPGCILGDEMDCLVMVRLIVCVTEPCDTGVVCVAWGFACLNLG